MLHKSHSVASVASWLRRRSGRVPKKVRTSVTRVPVPLRGVNRRPVAAEARSRFQPHLAAVPHCLRNRGAVDQQRKLSYYTKPTALFTQLPPHINDLPADIIYIHEL
ncbi:hypothetical protein NDU88_004650 [Pleurodeles waltl]|uniref:Uncharacterized protein n=1 Tax=Pleurodeles waltl TaxID=8319 RepID=A0AAV7RJV7_PLEWA|nr:hypothetical protein NDU88_004650 [Pleurodeles waltl]